MQFVQLKRREFISLLGTAAAVWPRASRAQQPAPVIGMLAVTSPEANTIRLRAFREALGAAGYVQGQNGSLLSPPNDTQFNTRAPASGHPDPPV